MTTNTTSKVILTSGEELDAPQDRIEGVMTDAGLIPWAYVLGWRIYHPATRRWVTVPLD